MKRTLAGLLLSCAVVGSCLAQGGGPANTVPFGQGAGRSFGFAGPCLTGVPLIGAGVGSPPICHSSAMSIYAPLASPTFTGNPLAPTPATADSDTSIATTAFVQANLALVTFPTTTYPTRAAAIAANIPAAITSLRLQGYSAAGDSGQDAIYIIMTCPVVTAPDFQDAGGRCWHLSVTTPRLGMFGADPTGATSSLTAINNWITYTYSRNLCGLADAGKYTFAGPITIDSTTSSPAGNGPCLEGVGMREVTWNNTVATAHDFIIDNTVFGMNGGRFGNFQFIPDTPKTAGYSIVQINDADGEGLNAGFKIHDILFRDTHGGISIQTSFYLYLDNLYFYSIGADAHALHFEGASSLRQVNSFNVSNLYVINGTGSTSTTAVYIGNYVAGGAFSNFHIQGGAPTNIDYGIWIAGTTGVDHHVFSNGYVDAMRKNALRIDGGTRIHWTNGGLFNSGNGYDGVLIAGGSYVTINGSTISGMQRNGISVTSGHSISITNNILSNIGFEGAGTGNYDDIRIAGGIVNFVIANNNHCVTGQPTPARYNIRVDAGASNNYVITDNITNCFTTGGVSNLGTGTRKNVSGNVGSNWTTYTPTVSCDGGGAPTTSTAAGRYETAANRLTLNISVVVTTLGPCTGSLRATLPFNATTAAAFYVGSGYDVTNGLSIPFVVQGSAGLGLWRFGAGNPTVTTYYGTVVYESP